MIAAPCPLLFSRTNQSSIHLYIFQNYRINNPPTFLSLSQLAASSCPSWCVMCCFVPVFYFHSNILHWNVSALSFFYLILLFCLFFLTSLVASFQLTWVSSAILTVMSLKRIYVSFTKLILHEKTLHLSWYNSCIFLSAPSMLVSSSYILTGVPQGLYQHHLLIWQPPAENCLIFFFIG